MFFRRVAQSPYFFLAAVFLTAFLTVFLAAVFFFVAGFLALDAFLFASAARAAKPLRPM